MKKHRMRKLKKITSVFATPIQLTMLLLTVVMAFSSTAWAEKITIGKESNQVTVVSSKSETCILDVTIGSFEKKDVLIGKETFAAITLPGEALLKRAGEPELPRFSRSISIPAETGVSAKIVDSEYVEYKMPVAPSKGILSRSTSPDKVPFAFSKLYGTDAFYPKDMVTVGTPYLLREVRGVSVDIIPFAYNPVTGILRVYHHLTIALSFEGYDSRNTLQRADGTYNMYFAPVYEKHFINMAELENIHIITDDDVLMLVIADDDFMDEMEAFVDHKNDIGMYTKMVGMSEVGSTTVDIKDYIQDYYDTHDSLTYVLLVGDHAQIPSPTYLGGGSDPSYSLLSGSDNYPDVFIGRFSAENSTHVETMVERSIIYETTGKGSAWFHNGMGIGSSGGTGDDGEYDYEHVRNIRDVLYGWHYTDIGEFYAGSQGGDDAAGSPSQAAIAAAVNSGVSIINYTGHGGTTSWSTSGFSNTNVNTLTNDNELPFIFSVACVNGNFTNSTCFAEAWLRARNSTTGNPTGAIAFYGSSINQSWSPPMEAQDEFNAMLANEDYASFGALCYNASSAMMDAYGAGDGEAGTKMFLTWHIFGDPSINVGPPCFEDLPEPTLVFTGTTAYTVGTRNYTRYNLKVSNWARFPNQLFEEAPHLPACGSNVNASRTWVHIYNAVTGKRLYGFCALDSNDDLTRLWFAVPEGSTAPGSVYITLEDRDCEIEYFSNTVLTRTLVLYPVGTVLTLK